MKRTRIAAIIFMVFMYSCEKNKDYGSALYEGDEMISYLCWSEQKDELYFTVERNNYRRTIYGVDINTGNSWKVGDITSNYAAPLFQKEDMLLYFSDLAYMNTKLYSIETAGGNPEMIIDSLEYPAFSKKYIAYLKSYNYPDTSYTRVILYDLGNKTKSIISSERNCTPVTISPDGSTLLLRWWNFNFYSPYLAYYYTGTGLTVDLSTPEDSYYFNYFWRDNEVYAFGESGMGIYSIYNMATRQKLPFSEPLVFQNYYAVSPSGNKISYVVVEPPALAEGWVGNHYYLNILRSGESGKTVIDMAREYISENTIIYSPDETRVAYVRNNTDIYVMDID